MKRKPSPEAWRRVAPILARMYRDQLEREQERDETKDAA